MIITQRSQAVIAIRQRAASRSLIGVRISCTRQPARRETNNDRGAAKLPSRGARSLARRARPVRAQHAAPSPPDPALRMRLMRHKTADLTLGVYDKTENDELRHELARLPVANALRLAAGAESASVLMHVHPGPEGATRGRCGPLDAPTTTITQSANVARTRRSRPQLAEAGRSGPEPEAACEVVGPAGLEPATRLV